MFVWWSHLSFLLMIDGSWVTGWTSSNRNSILFQVEGLLVPVLFAILHDGVMKWKHFPHYWPFVRGIHRSPVNSPHKGQWRGALMFSLICVWIKGWVNRHEAGDLRRHHAHYDISVMVISLLNFWHHCSKPLYGGSQLYCCTNLIMQSDPEWYG